MIIAMPRIARGRQPTRAIRVPDALWADYDAACEALGLSRSEDLVAHMEQRVRAWKRRHPAAGRADPGT